MLRKTLAALSGLTYSGEWEAMVVDNNSTDHTRACVEEAQPLFPVPLRYHFEPTPGKYWALNSGIRISRGGFIAATDDDACPRRDWLERAAEGFEDFGCDFVGGPVYPIWGGTPPRWIDARNAVTGKVLGLQDHGPGTRDYGRDGLSWPLGVNVAYRRDAFTRAGMFDGRLGRVAGTLRNQSQREWHLRAHAQGLRGVYLPGMIVHHAVEAERLTRRYFLRWFYWHGISRAILYQNNGVHLLEPEGAGNHAGERHVLGVPASIWRAGARAVISAARRWSLGRFDAAVPYEQMICFCAGVVRQRVKDRALAPPTRYGGRPPGSTAVGSDWVPSFRKSG
jgi:glycosyltransferase involved in cell wall biosynthesis